MDIPPAEISTRSTSVLFSPPKDRGIDQRVAVKVAAGERMLFGNRPGTGIRIEGEGFLAMMEGDPLGITP